MLTHWVTRSAPVSSRHSSLLCQLVSVEVRPPLTLIARRSTSPPLAPQFAENSLRYALLAFTPGYLWCAWHFWRASRTVIGDLAKTQEHRTELEVSGVEVVAR